MKKKVNLLLLGSTFVFSLTTVSCAQTSANQMADVWKKMGEFTVEVAKAMPAEHYTFSPVKDLRTFSQQMYHMGNNYWGAKFVNASLPQMNESASSDKEKVIKDIESAFKKIEDAIRKLSSDKLAEVVDFYGTPKSRLHIIAYMMEHVTHTRGISIMYLRLKGIAPPEFRDTW